MAVIDERIKHWLSLEMKKVSQMLISNLTVFVQQATKLQINQALENDLSKQHEKRLATVEESLKNCTSRVDGVVRDQQTIAEKINLLDSQLNSLKLPIQEVEGNRLRLETDSEGHMDVFNQKSISPDTNLTAK